MDDREWERMDAIRESIRRHGEKSDREFRHFREARRAFALEMAVQMVAGNVTGTAVAEEAVRVARMFERYLTEESQ